ncbi:arsenate reductase (glutaredoxin) [Pasteurellaceae bacterium RH1A]|nr:arsenate reductase (glutaredoxin) [Pasteurellaceae bacterium RH1A]
MSITLYHNPKCSKSRETLALIRAKGLEPLIVEYLKDPLSVSQVEHLYRASGMSLDDLLRKEQEAYQTHIAGKNLSEAEIFDLIAQFPSLLNRPFVESDKGVRFCRPPELVYEIL